MAADESYQKWQQLILFTSKPSIAIRKSRLATLVQHNVERAIHFARRRKERERKREDRGYEGGGKRERGQLVCMQEPNSK